MHRIFKLWTNFIWKLCKKILKLLRAEWWLTLDRKAGGRDNGGPGIRPQMSRQPYYSAFVYDLDGNNIEAVCVKK